jgi:ABC-type lipoprotein export system ATPase subunit
MQLTFQKIVPIPLKDRPTLARSDVWNRDFLLDKGEHVFVKAPSGTGKTTLIHILYGLRHDYIGAAMWNKDDIARMDSEEVAKLRTSSVSIIFQDLRLFPELTAWENIEMKRGMTNAVSPKQVALWMERLGIAHKRDALAATMSYGEQQRTAIVRALAQPFHWLLMDEPFSHLDHENTAKAAELIMERVADTGAGLLLADLDENTYFPYTKTLNL